MALRILVTGASGYTGSRVARALVQEGFDVYALLRPGSSTSYLDTSIPNLRILRISSGAHSLGDLFEREQFHVVCHLAGISEAVTTAQNIQRLVDANLTFGTQLLEAGALTGCRAIVTAGSYWQYYDGANESPNSLYAATKIGFRAICQYYSSLRGVEFAELRLFDSYGPCDNRAKLLSLFEKAAAGEPVPMTSGAQVLWPIHVDDVARAFVCAVYGLTSNDANVRSAITGQSFAVPGPEPLTVREMAEIYEQIRKVNLPIQWGARPYLKGQIMVPFIGTRLAGWQPANTFKKWLEVTYA